MQIQAINQVIAKLKTAKEPLPVKKQKALGVWLERFLSLHDESFLTSVFIKLEDEAREALIDDPQTRLL